MTGPVLMQNKVYFPELSNISPKATIGVQNVIHAGIHIHDDVVIGNRCQLEAGIFIPNGVTIEDDCFIGPHVCFTNDPTLQGTRTDWKPTKTRVKKGARIGANATIRAGVTIGEGAIIGCGSVVLHSVPAGETWAGNPAKPIRKKATACTRGIGTTACVCEKCLGEVQGMARHEFSLPTCDCEVCRSHK